MYIKVENGVVVKHLALEENLLQSFPDDGKTYRFDFPLGNWAEVTK